MLSECGPVLCLVFLLISLTVGRADGDQDLRNPAPDFSRHTIVQPVVLHGRTKREISTTRNKNEAHHPEITISFSINGEEDYIFDLRLNQDLIPDNHILSYQDNGRNVLHKPKKDEIDLCHYGGSVRGKPGAWVAVSTCHGVQGIVFDGERMRYIEPAQDGVLNSQHYVYDHLDLINPNLRKYFRNGYKSSSKIHRMKRMIPRSKRSADGTIHEPFNANKDSHYVELALVTDSGVYEANNRDRNIVHHQMLMVANYLNAMFSPLNIFIAVVGVEVWETDKITVVSKSGTTLKNFSHYKNSILKQKIPHDNAQLLVQRSFDDSIVGLGYVNSMCVDGSCAIANNFTKNFGTIAMVMAHEMGHNFGMSHDDSKCECKGKVCIMNGSEYTWHWSSCSLKTLEEFWKDNEAKNYCLRNKPMSLFGSPTCGNGFVEPGEQCDCGTMVEPGAYNPCHSCCDPNTCMLRANATCGAGMCCDLQTCQLKSSGSICRAAQECDLPEYCDGRSEYCPDDVYVMNTTRCKEPGMMCMNKKCMAAYNYSMPNSMTCPSGCSGRGVCNSQGHCHCDAGSGPPDCALPGPGGSYDSGPATETSKSLTNFMIAMYVIFLGIIPALLLGTLLFVSRRNILQWYEEYDQQRLRAKLSRPVNSPGDPSTSDNTGGASAKFENINSQKISCNTITLPIQNKSKITPANRDININKGNIDLNGERDVKFTQTIMKTTLNVNKLSKEAPNATDMSHRNGFDEPSLQTKQTVNESLNESDFIKSIALVKLKPISNNTSNKNASREVNMAVTTKSKNNLLNETTIVTKLSNENEPDTKPPITRKPNVLTLSKEKSSIGNLSNENEPNAKPSIKLKPYVTSLPEEKSSISNLSIENEPNAKPHITPKPNVLNLSKEKSSISNLSNENEPNAKPHITPKPNVLNLSKEKSSISNLSNENEPNAKPHITPKPNVSNLSKEKSSFNKLLNETKPTAKPHITPKPNVSNLSKEKSSFNKLLDKTETTAKPPISSKPNVASLTKEKLSTSNLSNKNEPKPSNNLSKPPITPKPNVSNLSKVSFSNL